ncbi:MAG: L-2-hydroxyglutarate oxidase [Acidobacteria bacterium]|nr:MAG: L-2-hydroxyglutarate oxidase [Acidobacteriota bacterium]
MIDSQFDLVIVGGGIVGLATALQGIRKQPPARLAVLEKEAAVARHQSGHNSGVIHSGIYYKTGSLKAKNCVSGAARMVEFCREHSIPFEVCGKVVVATNEAERAGLGELMRRGTANGVPGLCMIGPEQLREMEPHCTGIAALHVPGTGITDYSRVALKYAELIQQSGGQVLINCEVRRIAKRAGEVVLETTRGAIKASRIINCAGLHSDRIMRLAGDESTLRIVPFRGEYYEIVPARRHLVRNLIYPVADPRFPFLGVHFTRRISGGIEAGPNAVLALKREGYRKTDFNVRDAIETAVFPGFWRMAVKYWRSGVGEYYRSLRKQAFTRALQKLVPEIQSSDLEPAGAGVRAQALDRSGRLLDDFVIVRSNEIIHVCNVPSPAATASLVIGEQIVEMLDA